MITFLQSVDYPGGSTLLAGISNSGVAVGETGPQGLIFDDGTFTLVKYPTDRSTVLRGMNMSGEAVGYFYEAPYLQGFTYENGAFSFFDYPGAIYTEPRNINDAGDIVGHYMLGGELQGYVYSDGLFQSLDYPGAYFTAPSDINNNGEIVGSFIGGAPDFEYGGGFLLSAGVYTEIRIPGAILTRPSGINDAGDIVGDYVTAAEVGTQNHGFVYSNGVFYTFDFPGAGWPGTVASDINNQGQIVGHWYDQFGMHGFLAAFTTAGAPPVAEADFAAVEKRGAVSGNVLANDHDPDGDPLVVSAVAGGALGQTLTGTYGSLLLNADGSYAYAASKNAPAPQHGLAQDRFTYTISDGEGGTDQATLTIAITQKGQNYLAGTPGADSAHLAIVEGGNGKDVLDGSLGLQHLFGGNGADVLIGGPGDLLTGGKGADLFVFGPGSGDNLVTDFAAGLDQLQFDADTFVSFDDMLQDATQVGADVVIALGAGDVVTLAGVNLSSLSAADVILL